MKKRLLLLLIIGLMGLIVSGVSEQPEDRTEVRLKITGLSDDMLVTITEAVPAKIESGDCKIKIELIDVKPASQAR
jgi:hypothetical protein